MKTLQLLIFIILTLPLFGQTKTDFINCLNLAFDQNEFQPAFSSHQSTKGNLIIVSAAQSSLQSNLPTLTYFRHSLTNDDFRDSDHYVKVVRPNELQSLGIPKQAALEIFASGNELEMTINISCQIWDESQMFSWTYSFVKQDEEWEIKGNSLDRRRVTITEW